MTIITSRDGAIVTITIDRPHARNAVDPETARALRNAFEIFDADETLSVAILTGAGTTFCAGFDLKTVGDVNVGYDPDTAGPMGPTRTLLSKPVIAAIEGHAVAGGLELALWCDLRVASETAIFGVFCRRWGVPLIDGGTVRLPRIIGQGRALDMILTGRPVAAAEAHGWGLVDRLVPAGEALATARALAADIAKFPQICMRTDRASTFAQWDMTLSDALYAEAQGGIAPLTAEAEAGAARFANGEGRGGRFS